MTVPEQESSHSSVAPSTSGPPYFTHAIHGNCPSAAVVPPSISGLAIVSPSISGLATCASATPPPHAHARSAIATATSHARSPPFILSPPWSPREHPLAQSRVSH